MCVFPCVYHERAKIFFGYSSTCYKKLYSRGLWVRYKNVIRGRTIIEWNGRRDGNKGNKRQESLYMPTGVESSTHGGPSHMLFIPLFFLLLFNLVYLFFYSFFFHHHVYLYILFFLFVIFHLVQRIMFTFIMAHSLVALLLPSYNFNTCISKTKQYSKVSSSYYRDLIQLYIIYFFLSL